MVRKTGKKAIYIKFNINGTNEVEVKEIVNGYEMGVSISNANSTYYTMIPKALAGADAKRSKLVWLKSDKANAVAKFYAITAELRGDSNVITIKKEDASERITLGLDKPTKQKVGLINKATGKVEVKQRLVHKIKADSLVDIPEAYCIEWLKRELQNPKELARKTGIEAFNDFREWMLKKHITLQEIYTNYTNSIRYSKIKDKDTKKKTKKAWDDFLKLIGKTTVEQVTLEDAKAFERFLHRQDLADKTINHYKSNVTKVFKYNFDKVYVGHTDLKQILEYFNAWEYLDINSSDTIAAQVISKQDFIKLYKAADKKGNLQLKAVMMLCLNTGTYLREVARFNISDIDLRQQTLMTQRNKRGRCRKFAYLWDRTVKDMKAYLATRKDVSDILFKARHGGAYKDGEGLRTQFYKLRKNYKLLNVEFQHLRDTFQTVANEVGVTQYHSNMVMGHSTGKTSERYSHRRMVMSIQKRAS